VFASHQCCRRGDVATNSEMGGCLYSFFLTFIVIIAVNQLDCDALGTATYRNHHAMRTPPRTAVCRHQLSYDIEACLTGYERLLVSSRALDKKPGQLERSVARGLCRLVGQFVALWTAHKITPQRWRYRPTHCEHFANKLKWGNLKLLMQTLFADHLFQLVCNSTDKKIQAYISFRRFTAAT